MGFRLETYNDNWHFKDSVKTRFGNPYMWHMNIFQFWNFDSTIWASTAVKSQSCTI